MASAVPRPDATARGLRWIVVALALFLASSAALLALFLALLPAMADVLTSHAPRALVDDPLSVASLAVAAVDLVAAVIFTIGYADLWGSRSVWGEDHARAVAQSLPLLLVTGLIVFAGVFVPAYTGPLYRLPLPGDALPSWAITAEILLGGVRALFAGLALYFALQGLAEPLERTRLILGMTLGVVGGVAWPGLVAYGMESAAVGSDLLTAIASGVLAGLGTSVVSLAVFLRVARAVRGRTGSQAGRPGPRV